MKTLVLDIQKCSIHDGPGLRTTVFLKGCPLRCAWCHNPESQRFEKQLRYFREKCQSCRQCEQACEQQVHHIYEDGKHTVDFEKCIQCGKCMTVCKAKALQFVGQEMSVEQVMEVIREDVAFYKRSKGGVTITGGEPLSHPEFVSELLRCCKEEGIHTCIETSGVGRREALEQIAPYVDLFLVDYKLTDDVKHREYVGCSNKQVVQTLDDLEARHKTVILRCPIIPNVNDDEVHLSGIAAIKAHYQMIDKVELMAYHNIGISKAHQIGMIQCSYEVPNPQKITDWQEKLNL